MKKTRPIFKWAGGKYNCIEKIVSALPAGPRLIEPFTGAATIFFNTRYPRYLLAESNPDLVLFYQQLRQNGEDFIAYCQSYFTPQNNQAARYYALREHFNQTCHAAERAALFLYLNRHGYNGLCRYNQSGQYNVPFGQYSRSVFPETAMRCFMARAQDVEFLHADFRQTFQQARAGDIIYCDPPYVSILPQQRGFHYDKAGFKEGDQIELARLAEEYSQQGVHVLLSNHDTDFTRSQYQAAQIISFPVKRYISCKINERKPVRELLAIFSAR
ncbi:MAG: Dam family site-specific DNA-(adenine-N6)-methyltransferase [Legionellaceae bacterium]|nr:Dam family site-specific DNA-(adenine-N6)-methyltransferase [Legionellaceae bacterium]